MRNWNEGWSSFKSTIDQRDVWLLTDHIKLNYLQQYLSGPLKALEVGCGSAKLSALLAEQGVSMTGLDNVPQALRVAHNNFSLVGVPGNFLQGDAFHLPFPEQCFDLVFSTGLLEHFEDPTPIVSEMTRVLRSGGLFFSDIAPLKFSLLRAGFYLRGYHKQVKDEYPFKAHDIAQWLEQAGLKNISVFPSGVVPPLILVRRVRLIRSLAFRFDWSRFDNTLLAEKLGFFYLAFATK
jgi:2-polyprenyl-3-methyl-5-hydroxy-6-metoxy-1,4-benzoquinol methylase